MKPPFAELKRLMSWPEQIFLSAAQQRLFATGLPVLMYHKIGLAHSNALDPFLYVSTENFDTQLRTLGDTGFSASTLDVDTGKENPGKKIVITFDDGSESVFKNGLDLLARHRFGAIQFIVAGLIGKHNEWDVAKGETSDRMMDKIQIREWLAAGNQIGSHTMTHPNLNRVAPAQAREEIFASKKLLEDVFGVSVRHFSYPSGKWNPQVQELVAQAGYTTASGVEFGVNSSEASRFDLRRVVPLSSAEFWAKAFHRLKRRLVASR